MLEPTRVVLAAWDLTDFLVVGVIVLVVALISSVFGGRCPKCKRFFAFNKTGAKGTEPGRLGYVRSEEWLCKHCDHREWKNASSSGWRDGDERGNGGNGGDGGNGGNGG